MQRKKTVLITGGTGFIGYNLIQALIVRNWDVHAILRPESDVDKLKDIAKVHIFKGTAINMAEIIDDANPDMIYHLAACSRSNHYPEDVSPMITSNILMPTLLLEALSKRNKKYFINTGTFWQHYANSDYSPTSLYAATKQAFQDILQYYAEVQNVKSITLELFDTFGPNDWRRKILQQLEEAKANNKALDMTMGEQLVDMVYIDDVVRAYIHAAELILCKDGVVNEIYSVKSGRLISIRELVELYNRVSGGNIVINWGKKPYRKREIMVPPNLRATLPGWDCCISLEEGLKQFLMCRKTD